MACFDVSDTVCGFYLLFSVRFGLYYLRCFVVYCLVDLSWFSLFDA